MSKLTHGDIQELTAFFESPLSAALGHGIAAQSYEPRGKAGYDPSTDSKLVSMVFAGIRHGKNTWARMKRVIDQLTDAQVEVLRLMCRGGREAVSCRMPRALEAGRRRAHEEQRQAHLRAVFEVMGDPLSPITTAMRVLEADRRPFVPSPMTVSELVYAAELAIEDQLVDVERETDALIEAAAAAYHAAAAQVAAWSRRMRGQDDDRRASFRAELAGKRAVKERSRFERALRSAS